MGECLWLTGEHTRSFEVTSRALETADALEVFPSQVASRFVLGHACHALGNRPQAVEFLSKNVECLVGDLLNRRLGHAGIASVLSRTWLAWSLGELGDFSLAFARATEALQIADAAAHPFSQASARLSLGVLHVLLGDPRRAVHVLEPAQDLCRTWELSLNLPFVAGYLGPAYAGSDNFARADALVKNAASAAASMGIRCGQALLVACQGEVQARTGLEGGLSLSVKRWP
jgi:tetratricopeptide (TPR) repeat protein